MSKHEAFNLIEIGKRLRTIRAYQRKTQSVMAKELGISLSHYSKLEIGIGGMSHGLALALCRQFSLPENWLLYGTGPQPDLNNMKAVTYATDSNAEMTQKQTGISDELLTQIMTFAQEDNFQALAEEISTKLNIPLPRAMAMLMKEKLRNYEDER